MNAHIFQKERTKQFIKNSIYNVYIVTNGSYNFQIKDNDHTQNIVENSIIERIIAITGKSVLTNLHSPPVFRKKK